MPRTERHADEALTLRRAAIRLLAGRSTPAAFLGSVAGIGDQSWSVFLTMEQCAEPLRQRLGVSLPVLDRFALEETKRSLSARAQLHTVADISRRQGWSVVALKGAVAAADQTTSLQDVDVLARPEVAASLLEALATQLGTQAEGPVSKRHLASLGVAAMLPIEVHRNIDTRRTRLTEEAWTRIIPLAAVPGLFRLAPRDHVIHMLSHVVIDHPERRGRLRDSLLLFRGLAECAEADRKSVAAEVERNPYADALKKQLRFAEAFAGNESGFPLMESEAYSRFWLFQHRSAIWKMMENAVWSAAIGSVSGWRLGPMLMDGLREPPARRSKFGPTAWVEQRIPPLGQAMRVGIRAVHYALGLSIGIPLGWFIKRGARRAGVGTAV